MTYYVEPTIADVLRMARDAATDPDAMAAWGKAIGTVCDPARFDEAAAAHWCVAVDAARRLVDGWEGVGPILPASSAVAALMAFFPRTLADPVASIISCVREGRSVRSRYDVAADILADVVDHNWCQ